MSVIRSLAFYLLFYAGGFLLCVLTILALPFGRRAVAPLAHTWSRFQRWCAKWLLGITIQIEGERAEGPVLYAFKHESFFEAIDMPTLLKDPAVFAKQELFAIPGWGGGAKIYGLVPVARDQGARALRQMVRAASELSEQGRPLVIFPEGTRVPHGEEPRLQAGFAGLYKLLGLPVVPVAVYSGPLYHRRWKRPGTILIRFGEPIAAGLPRREVEERVHAAINYFNREGRDLTG